MKPESNVSEIIKEYRLSVPEKELTVFARVLRDLTVEDGIYFGEVSHEYYLPNGMLVELEPSSRRDPDQMKIIVLQYLRNFDATNTVINKSFFRRLLKAQEGYNGGTCSNSVLCFIER